MFVYGNHAPDALPPSVWHQWCSLIQFLVQLSQMLIDVRWNDDVGSGKSAILAIGASSRALHLAILP
jgi:hypothetical protein